MTDVDFIPKKFVVVSETEPAAFEGLIWYNPTTKLWKMYKDGKWQILIPFYVGDSEPAEKTDGMLWYDTANNVLKVYDEAEGTFQKVGIGLDDVKNMLKTDTDVRIKVYDSDLDGTIDLAKNADKIDDVDFQMANIYRKIGSTADIKYACGDTISETEIKSNATEKTYSNADDTWYDDWANISVSLSGADYTKFETYMIRYQFDIRGYVDSSPYCHNTYYRIVENGVEKGSICKTRNSYSTFSIEFAPDSASPTFTGQIKIASSAAFGGYGCESQTDAGVKNRHVYCKVVKAKLSI